ncbi:hypothetical protein GCM10022197_23270 [Microlunatus spumicola]|uniref:Transcriptional regulator, AbiEi antitoxin, Type IV TA system n=1 Tax=Microlunatus spumicola TaxID=81499 RepID=A0ABP6XGT6_9ACTN
MSEIRTHAQLVREGFAADEIRRLSRSGSIVPVRRGAYVAAGARPDRATAHRRLVEATVAQAGPGAVVSHVSAAVQHDLPVPYADLSKVHLTRDREGGGRTRRWVQVHGARLLEQEVTTVEDVAVTTLPRTFVDLARTLPTRTSVAAGDAILRSGVSLEVLQEAVGLAAGRHGVGAARRALRLLDARAESAGESVSRVVMAERGLPAPEPQLVIRNEVGGFVARVDFAWPSLGVIGEFDGRVKYGRTLDPDEDRDPVDVLWSEKQREDQLRRLGWLVVRWVWDDLEDAATLERRIRNAFAYGRPMP